MRTYTAALYLIATDTFCGAFARTPDAARRAWAQLERAHEVTAEGIDTTPRLALVDREEAPRAWTFVTDYYRIRHVDRDPDAPDAYDVGEAANFFADRADAIRTAQALDAIGWDTEVVAFHDVTGRGRVVWG